MPYAGHAPPGCSPPPRSRLGCVAPTPPIVPDTDGEPRPGTSSLYTRWGIAVVVIAGGGVGRA
jgi:hypothetical protein